MRSSIVVFAMALNAVTAPVLASAADHDFTLKSVSVTWPSDSRYFPDGPGADVTNANCLTCHSAGMVLNQPNLSKAAWQAEVEKIIALYKAPIQPDAVPEIVNYLTNIKGGTQPTGGTLGK